MGTSIAMMARMPVVGTRGTTFINLDMFKLEINTLYDNIKARSKKKYCSKYWYCRKVGYIRA
jgi:hypothetical protein